MQCLTPIPLTRSQLLKARLRNSSYWLNAPAGAKLEQLYKHLPKAPSKIFSESGQKETDSCSRKKSLTYSSAKNLAQRMQEVTNMMSSSHEIM